MDKGGRVASRVDAGMALAGKLKEGEHLPYIQWMAKDFM